MASPQVKLANSLAVLKTVQESGLVIELSKRPELTRVHRERLQDAGFIVPIIQGWYLSANPDEAPGSSTAWYAHMDEFVAAYANSRFGDRWQASPEVSVRRLSGETGVIQQIVLHSPAANNQVLNLSHGSSIFMNRVAGATLSRGAVALPSGLRVLPLAEALVHVSPQFFISQRLAAEIAVRSVDVVEMSRVLLGGDHSTRAGRMAGALRAVGRTQDAHSIVSAMHAAGHRDVRLVNPFDQELVTLDVPNNESPHATRVRVMWAQMRPDVLKAFDGAPRVDVTDTPAFLADIEARYQADAYHSLSIEGYRVTDDLIQRVRAGDWRPEGDPSDKEVVNALNARGYYELHSHVLALIRRVFESKEDPGALFRGDLDDWYRVMYGPSVRVGIVPATALAGYRNHPIFIRNARHVPPAAEWVRESMTVFLQLMAKEPDAAVRAVLGHFIFVYIHPYLDGNGRIGRFILNFMLTTAGYRWTVVTLNSRDEYMKALDAASGDKDIGPFAQFLARLVREQHQHPVEREAPHR